jgi:hypothetical protein
MSEGCDHKFEVGGSCVRCGDTSQAVQVAALQGLVERYEKIATNATRLAESLERALDAKHADLVEVADKLRALRIEHAAGGNDAHWLLKDFNVLYAVTRALLLAVGTGDETKTARALDAVAAQLTRLKPAFTETEEVKRIFRDKGRG